MIWLSGHLVIWLLITRSLARTVRMQRRMSAQSELLKARTFSFSLAILRIVDKLPRTTSGFVIARQCNLWKVARHGASQHANL
jgi:hypothetical protein